MNRQVKRISRGLILALSATGLAACSSSVDRFADYPNVNTASVPNKVADNTVQRSTLSDAPKYGQVRPSWQQPARSYKAPARTAYKAPATRDGSVTVRSGQTMYSIARANGLKASQLARANGISYPYTIKVGQRLTIPGVSNPSSPSPSFTPQPRYRAASAPVQHKSYAGRSTHTVTAGETLFSLGRTYNLNPYRIARYNGLSAPYSLNVGQVVKIPPNGSSNNTRAAGITRQPARTHSLTLKAPQRTAKNADRIAPAPAPAPVSRAPEVQPLPAPVETADSGFRWPVKGRVISSYGRKANGMRNEGINISVPEGTSVRAAESGVVAYAGNELKGYGNLVLIRHRNGWVTAYAHNKELYVKRGDTVKRGDVIAKAGQTGSVSSPQLHFEVRKGSTAVNPMKYLTSRTALN